MEALKKLWYSLEEISITKYLLRYKSIKFIWGVRMAAQW